MDALKTAPTAELALPPLHLNMEAEPKQEFTDSVAINNRSPDPYCTGT
jgi:hypothetical protein